MATKYCDRAFISVNGAPIVDLESASLKQNRNAKAVPTMTRDRFNLGFVEGNTDIDINVVIAIQNTLARPKLDQVNYEAADVQITFVAGVEQFIATGVFNKDTEDNASGVGAEVKTTFNFGALKLLDAAGNSALFNLVL
ncbi:MAG: hypothetical protein HC842_07130 [Cytophagales bacterium]|nr:hypothetical protein [Cytophagales bacterium]